MKAKCNSPKNRGIINITRKPRVLVAPVAPSGSERHVYGFASFYQVAARKAAVFVSLRKVGYPVGDFENGVDVILFDGVSQLGSAAGIPITRNDKYIHPETGQPRIVIKYPMVGGFVPLGALREDSSPHPHAGTGFAFNEGLDFPMKGDGYYDKSDKTKGMVRHLEVHQFSYDHQSFRTLESEKKNLENPLAPLHSVWNLIAPGLTQAIPDGDDLLFPVSATPDNPCKYNPYPMATGVSRWRRHDGRWQLSSFVPVAHSKEAEKPQIIYGQPQHLQSAEPSLIRDLDGSLLFTARFVGDEVEDHVVRIFRSDDHGRNWKLIIDAPGTRGQAPVTINKAGDGTPYVVGNKFGHERDWLCIWPLNENRTGLEEPVTVRNALEEFGSPPKGPVWFMDHPTGATLQLADGQWHHLLTYRNMDRGEHAGGNPTLYTGQYIEEVISQGPAVPVWNFG